MCYQVLARKPFKWGTISWCVLAAFMVNSLARMCDRVGLSWLAKRYIKVGRSFKSVMVLAKVVIATMNPNR